MEEIPGIDDEATAYYGDVLKIFLKEYDPTLVKQTGTFHDDYLANHIMPQWGVERSPHQMKVHPGHVAGYEARVISKNDLRGGATRFQ